MPTASGVRQFVSSWRDYTETVLLASTHAGAEGPDWRDLLAGNGITLTRAISDPDALATQPPEPGAVLLVAGGDGTVNDVVRRVLDRDCALAVLPGGTGNDFARALGVPLDPERACSSLGDTRERRVDVTEINDQVLLNAAHVGIGSEVSGRRARRFKRAWGRFSYLRGLLAQLAGRSGFRATIETPTHTEAERWWNITIANGHSFGGGHAVDPAARLDDGLLDVLALKQRPWWQLLWAALLKRLGFSYPDALRHWRVEWVRIETARPRQVVVDGDPLTRTPLRARVRPGALRVLVAQAGPGLAAHQREDADAA